jgi:hypothetical protein
MSDNRVPAPTATPRIARATPPITKARPSWGPTKPLFCHAIRNVKIAGIAASRNSSMMPVSSEPIPAAAAAPPSTKLRVAARFNSDGLLREPRLGQVADDLLVHPSAPLHRLEHDLPALTGEVDHHLGCHCLVFCADLKLAPVPRLL